MLGLRTRVLLTIMALVALAAAAEAQDRERSAAADWPMYLRDLTGSRYSPLRQITTANVGRLEQVWHYRFNRDDRPRISAPSPF